MRHVHYQWIIELEWISELESMFSSQLVLIALVNVVENRHFPHKIKERLILIHLPVQNARKPWQENCFSFYFCPPLGGIRMIHVAIQLILSGEI